jgi:heterotetrameric sarcosine oxidase gamma subunit
MSSAPNSTVVAACRIDGPSGIEAREFQAFLFPLVGTATADLPASPGAVQHDSAGRAAVLHFAPGRFLVPAPAPDLVRHLDALALAGVGAVFNAAGKWRAIRVAGAGAERVLAAGIDVAAVLSRRDCAAVQLLDCPVVLARASDGFELWVQASYAADLAGSLERIRTASTVP